jgi:RNA polymerase sigma-70 factor (ECF subfamily)
LNGDLQRGINTLSHEQREVLLLVGLEGMRYEQVATILDIPVGTVRSRLSRGRDTLRKMLDGGLETTPWARYKPGYARRAS